MLSMTTPAKELPSDVSTLQGLVAEQVLENLRKEEIIERHAQELSKLRAQNDRLIEMIRLLRHHRFGKSSEKVPVEEKQLGIFNEAELEASAEKEEEEPTVEIKSYRRRGKPKRKPLPDDLPREEVIVELPVEKRFCPEGHALEEIGEDVSERLDVIPAQMKVIRTIRKKYACRCCAGHVTRAPLPPMMIPKGIAAPGLLAQIVTSKYADGLPLYRQEQIWKRLGVDLSRTTMASWIVKIGKEFIRLTNLLAEILLAGDILGIDETTLQVLNEEGKTAESKSYMWVRGRNYPGAPPIVLFEYDPTRQGNVACRLLEGFTGYLQSDAYGGYNSVGKVDGMVRIGCWAHDRRKFFEASKASKKGAGLANEALEQIRALYKIEEQLKDASAEERYRVRQESSKPLLEKFKTWLEKHQGTVPVKSQLGIALNYTLREWPRLIRYLDDGRLSIDNNFIENAIRPFAIGRKNWLFSDSVAGAEASAAIYSVMATAKLNGHNVYAYMRHLIEHLPQATTAEEVVALLPTVLKPADVPTDFLRVASPSPTPAEQLPASA